MCRAHFQVPCVAEEELPGVSVAGLAARCLLSVHFSLLSTCTHYWLKLLHYCITLLVKNTNDYVFLHRFSLNVSFILIGTLYKYKL